MNLEIYFPICKYVQRKKIHYQNVFLEVYSITLMRDVCQIMNTDTTGWIFYSKIK